MSDRVGSKLCGVAAWIDCAQLHTFAASWSSLLLLTSWAGYAHCYIQARLCQIMVKGGRGFRLLQYLDDIAAEVWSTQASGRTSPYIVCSLQQVREDMSVRRKRQCKHGIIAISIQSQRQAAASADLAVSDTTREQRGVMTVHPSESRAPKALDLRTLRQE